MTTLTMKTKLVLKPGQHGTLKWSEKYGNKLVAVRYRYDRNQGKRYKTIEIIVEETEWIPEVFNQGTAINPTDKLGIRVEGYEKSIREKVKQAGGICRPRPQLWELSYRQILLLGLEDRIVTTEIR